jgi:hypothetical protein
MRVCLLLISFGCSLATDTFANGSALEKAAWREAQREGQILNQEVAKLLPWWS